MNYFEIEELASLILCEGREEEAEALLEEKDIEEDFHDRYGINLDTFSNLINDLLPFTPTVQSVLGDNNYHAFVNNGRMIVQQESKLKEEEK